MEQTPSRQVKTIEQARQEAMNYQIYSSVNSMSYAELADWQDYFKKLGKKFKLTREFRENGVI